MDDLADHNRAFPLTHPNPPSHAWVPEVLCRRFRLGGMRFVGPGRAVPTPEDPLKKMPWEQVRRMFACFNTDPHLDREHTDEALPDLPAPVPDEDFVNRLLD